MLFVGKDISFWTLNILDKKVDFLVYSQSEIKGPLRGAIIINAVVIQIFTIFTDLNISQ